MYYEKKVKCIFLKNFKNFLAHYFFIEKNQKTYIIGVSLERRLMVGQEILVLFIMVRIRALQPIFKRTLVVRFNIGFVAPV